MNVRDTETIKKREFIIIKRGLLHILHKTSDIAYVYMENEITYLISKDGVRHVCFDNLNSIEEKLDDDFFRANRQHIINIAFIKSYRIYEKGKIMVDMLVNESRSPICISQRTSPKFREWITRF